MSDAHASIAAREGVRMANRKGPPDMSDVQFGVPGDRDPLPDSALLTVSADVAAAFLRTPRFIIDRRAYRVVSIHPTGGEAVQIKIENVERADAGILEFSRVAPTPKPSVPTV